MPSIKYIDSEASWQAKSGRPGRRHREIFHRQTRRPDAGVFSIPGGGAGMIAPSTKGAVSYQPGASPQEWNHPTKPRTESPIQWIAGYEDWHQFRGVTKMIVHGIGRAFSPRNVVRSQYLGRCPRLASGRVFGPQIRQGPQIADMALVNASLPTIRTVLPSSAPTAHLYTSLGHRPRITARKPHEG